MMEIIIANRVQTGHALTPSTESQYAGLSYGQRDTIPIMELLKEMKDKGYPVKSSNAQVY